MEGLLAYIKAIKETVACSRILGPIDGELYRRRTGFTIRFVTFVGEASKKYKHCGNTSSA